MGSQPSKPEAGGDQSLSLKSAVKEITDITGSFVKINVGVAEYILKFKEDKSRDADLKEIEKGYVENSNQILKVCTALKDCIKRARIIEEALQKFETGERESGLNLLEGFGKPFTEFFSLLKPVHEDQRKLDEKLNKVPTGRTTTNVIYGVAAASVLTCAAVFVPVLWGAVASLVIVPIGVGAAAGAVWINNLGKEREKELRAQGEIIEGRYNIWKTEFGEIESGVDDLKRDAARQTMDRIKTKLKGFMESIEELNKHADKCEEDVKDGMNKIIKYRN